jgi:hypothetical protein
MQEAMEKSGCLTKNSRKVRLFSKEQWKSQAVTQGAVEKSADQQGPMEKCEVKFEIMETLIASGFSLVLF